MLLFVGGDDGHVVGADRRGRPGEEAGGGVDGHAGGVAGGREAVGDLVVIGVGGHGVVGVKLADLSREG